MIMGLQTGWTAILGVVLHLCTSAKRHEIFTASVASVPYAKGLGYPVLTSSQIHGDSRSVYGISAAGLRWE
jgi:hypothetical protein